MPASGAMTPAGPSFTLRSLVERFGGDCSGDLERRVDGFASLASATARQLSFVAAPRFRNDAAMSRAAAILVHEKDAALLAHGDAPLWVCADPYLQFARVAQFFEAATRPAAGAGIDATAVISSDASVDPTAIVGAHAVIEAGAVVEADVRIGAGSRIGPGSRIGAASLVHSNVTVYHGCRLGARCIVHSGAVIGADGFGFAKDGARWVKIPQTGGVVIGDDVEIGANTTIDRGTLDDTRIGDGVKLDNQIQIAHNVQVGDDTIMAAFVGIAGSAVIGARCMVGGAARIMGHVTVADDVVISTQTFVSRSIAKAGHYTGYYPMDDHASFEKNAAVVRRLEGLRERVRRLETLQGASAVRENPEPERPA